MELQIVSSQHDYLLDPSALFLCKALDAIHRVVVVLAQQEGGALVERVALPHQLQGGSCIGSEDNFVVSG